MLGKFFWAGSLAFTTALSVSPAQCAREPVSAHVNAVSMEVLVFEVENCAYCRVFRRDVAAQYERSKGAKIAPMRFIDARKADVKGLGLTQPLSLVPTVVIMREGRELGRISGYMGPEPFFHLISQTVGKPD